MLFCLLCTKCIITYFFYSPLLEGIFQKYRSKNHGKY
nr:MAG TPA: hypothetical protein [Caudoviricetes sp.]